MKRDLINVIEAAYAEAETEQSWLAGIAAAARPVLDTGLGTVSYTFDLPAQRPVCRTFLALGDDPEALTSCVLEMHAEAEPDVIVRAFNTNLAATLSSFIGEDLDEVPQAGPKLAYCGARDTLGVVAYDQSGAGVCLSTMFASPHTLSPSEHRTWLRIAAHLGAGFRLRWRDGPRTEAVLDPGGKLHDATGPARDREAQIALRQAARAIDRARVQRSRDPDEAVAIWRGLVSARWSLVDRFESDGRHLLIAKENRFQTPDVRPLSERERQVVSLAAHGRSNKLIAYELGIAVGTVSTLLTRAARKLGASSRTGLIAEWQRLEREADDDTTE